MSTSDLEKINLKHGMIDSHFHLFHMKKREMDYLEIINHCFDNGLEMAVDIGITPENFADRIETASKIPGLYTAHGFYPSQCSMDDPDENLRLLEGVLASDPKAVALGEIGLDFFHDYGSFEQQAELVIKQIDIADRLDKPVIIHSRDAESETVELLSEHRTAAGGIIHCYSYSPETAAKLLDLGYCISFAGNVTYKKSQLLHDSAKYVPLDKLLIETDAPYLSPQKVRSKKNHPGYIGYTYDFVAALRGISVEELISAVNANFRRVFSI